MIGYDKELVNHEQILALPFSEMVGAVTHDRSKPSLGAAGVQELHHSCTLHGAPTWNQLGNGLPYLDFDPSNPDYLTCPPVDSNDLDFTSEDFSIAGWVNFDNFAHAMRIIGRAELNVCGWVLYIWNGNLAFRTNQLGSRCGAGAPVGFFGLDQWYFIGFTRSGLVGQFYADGVAITTTHDPVGGLLDPIACGNTRALDIGIHWDHLSNPYDGKMWNLRVWRRCLSAEEMAHIYAAESKWFH